MANINLNNYYRRANEQHSAVDKSLITRHGQEDTEVYSDVKFDLRIKEITERPLNSKENDNDIQKITDAEAVITSLKNLIHTQGCTRLLNPEIDLGLNSFLFEPINEHTAFFIGYTLNNTIPAYEPRVQVDSIKVVGKPDDALYDITLVIYIPSLKKYIDFSVVLEEHSSL